MENLEQVQPVSPESQLADEPYTRCKPSPMN